MQLALNCEREKSTWICNRKQRAKNNTGVYVFLSFWWTNKTQIPCPAQLTDSKYLFVLIVLAQILQWTFILSQNIKMKMQRDFSNARSYNTMRKKYIRSELMFALGNMKRLLEPSFTLARKAIIQQMIIYITKSKSVKRKNDRFYVFYRFFKLKWNWLKISTSKMWQLVSFANQVGLSYHLSHNLEDSLHLKKKKNYLSQNIVQ